MDDLFQKYARDINEARARGDTYYFTGKPCKHGHLALRRTKGAQCMECTRLKNQEISAALALKPKKLKGPDHTGKRFGMWTVLERDLSDRRGSAKWRCLCDCGTQKVVAANTLIQGKSKSCGCMSQTWRTEGATKHGHAKSKPNGGFSGAYKSWHAMRQRCLNENNDQYIDYGGRGITICDAWDSFENFLADMGDRPPKMTLDRVDPNGNYEPGNCRWATRKMQSQNQRPRVRNSQLLALMGAARKVVAANDNYEAETAIGELRAALSQMDEKAA